MTADAAAGVIVISGALILTGLALGLIDGNIGFYGTLVLAGGYFAAILYSAGTTHGGAE